MLYARSSALSEGNSMNVSFISYIVLSIVLSQSTVRENN